MNEVRKLETGETVWSGVNGEATVGTGSIALGHLQPSGASARKWRNGVESGPPSLRGCARQLACQRIGTAGGMLVRSWEEKGREWCGLVED